MTAGRRCGQGEATLLAIDLTNQRFVNRLGTARQRRSLSNSTLQAL